MLITAPDQCILEKSPPEYANQGRWYFLRMMCENVCEAAEVSLACRAKAVGKG